MSPPGLVAGLDGKGSLSLGAGALQTLSPEPLRKVALTAAKKTIKVDKEEIAAETRTVRDTLTKGLYKYPPTQFTFEVKNGTVRLAPATLSTAGAATKMNFYLELASLKIDSEWAMTLTGADHNSVPPVNLVFTGSLNKASEIAPSIDTASIEEYLTMRLMQQDVERLETLDVSGKTQAAPDTAPDSEAPPVVEPEADTVPPAEITPPPAEPAEAEPVEGPRPRAESELPNKPKLQSDPSGDTSPPSINAMRMPVPNAESEGEGVVTPASTAAPPAVSSPGTAAPEAALPPEPPSAPPAPPEEATPEAALPPEPLSATPAAPEDGAPADTTTTSVVDQAAPAEVEVVPPARHRSVSKPRRPTQSGAGQEAPNSWKKGVGIFGGP